MDITVELPSIIATQQVVISECGHMCGAHAIVCYELYMVYLHTCLTHFTSLCLIFLARLF